MLRISQREYVNNYILKKIGTNTLVKKKQKKTVEISGVHNKKNGLENVTGYIKSKTERLNSLMIFVKGITEQGLRNCLYF